MKTLFQDKFFYHIYPLGLFGCAARNNFSCPAGNGLSLLKQQVSAIKELGCNSVYIGPLFESTAHGYDTVDYFWVDRRLGNNQSFKELCQEFHNQGISVVVDAVFNHTGRDFFAFKDLIQNGINSQYKDWYLNLNFNRRSCFNDPFDYEGWAGCMDLVKLNVENPQVRDHIFSAVKFWIEEFGIDGLRLDAADVLSKNFLSELSSFCKGIKEDFWLMGEVVHGDYNQWVQEGRLDSVTNYQIYKNMWSALNEQNLYELSYNLNREFGNEGMYKNKLLYNFADNHDVDRIASTLKDQRHLYLIYGILFSIPGIPSVYYGSEKGILGKRDSFGDSMLRPCLPPFTDKIPDFAKPQCDSKALEENIKRFARIRSSSKALQLGSYRELAISNTTFAFEREYDGEKIIVAINSLQKEQNMCINEEGTYEDLLNGGFFSGEALKNINIPACWIRILQRK